MRAPLPDFVEPCLATLADQVPAGEKWLHEIKWDGYRLAARVENGRVTLLTRRGLDWTHRFPPIAEAASKLSVGTAYLDGEAIVESRGIADFAALNKPWQRVPRATPASSPSTSCTSTGATFGESR
jgi:bifunctional non-homologous end joining protein LigD